MTVKRLWDLYALSFVLLTVLTVVSIWINDFQGPTDGDKHTPGGGPVSGIFWDKGADGVEYPRMTGGFANFFDSDEYELVERSGKPYTRESAEYGYYMKPLTLRAKIFAGLFFYRIRISYGALLIGAGIYLIGWILGTSTRPNHLYLVHMIYFPLSVYAALLVRWWGYG